MSLIDDINEGLRRPLTSEKCLTNVVADIITEVVDSIPTDVIKYRAGQNITISEDGTISATDMDTKYTEGKYISIGDDRVVNSTITAGTNINIDSTGKVSATDTKYTAGSNVQISANNVISATDTTYTAGTGIEISGNTINCTVEAGTDYTLPTASASILGGIKVGANLSIDSNGTLSATDTTYTDATTSKSGLMSATDKMKLDSLENYTLPTASDSVLGGVKVGSNLSIDENGVLSATDTTYSDATTSTSGLMSASDKTKLDGLNNYSLPTATQQSLGGIKVGTNLSITADGTLSASDTNTTYTAGQNVQISQDNVISATDTKYVAGTGIDITGNLISCTVTDTTYSDATTSASGLMSASDKVKLNGLSNYSLPTASASTLGGVKVGSNLVINDGVLSGNYGVADSDNDGLLSADDWRRFDNHRNYTLPISSTSTLGGIMVGDNLSIDASGKLSANFTLPDNVTFTTITLTDAEGSVSINASQLRQLLALLTPETPEA